jgi:hypothetical protein
MHIYIQLTRCQKETLEIPIHTCDNLYNHLTYNFGVNYTSTGLSPRGGQTVHSLLKSVSQSTISEADLQSRCTDSRQQLGQDTLKAYQITRKFFTPGAIASLLHLAELLAPAPDHHRACVI